MKYLSKSLEETRDIAQRFVDGLRGGETATVFALSGELGSGKTAFSQAFGSILGIQETMQSPTFVIEKIYPIDFAGFKNLIHIDAYRLDKESELLHLGWEEIIKEPENLVLIEWPERVLGGIPNHALRISFKNLGESVRSISYED